MQIIRDKVTEKPRNIKHVVISIKKFQEIRPLIKTLNNYGMWYDVSEYYNKIYLRCDVNEYTQSIIESYL